MANKEFHELITAEQVSASDVIAEQRENDGTWLTRKLTFNALGLFLNKVLNYASDLHTTSKTIIGAINELAQGSGQSLDTLNDVDIDSQTLADGQGIVYDATEQKWKNGAVSGGGHTYSTTEHVVGTWIDGSPIYEKVYEYTNPTAGNTIVQHGISNFDKIISVTGNFHRDDGYEEPVPYPTSDTRFVVSLVDFTSTEMTRVIGSIYTGTYKLTRATFIIRYTKTSS